MFFQGYGFSKLRQLVKKSGCAADLFLYISENVDSKNTLFTNLTSLGLVTGYSYQVVYRLIKILEEEGFIRKFKMSGTYMILVNSDIFWSSKTDNKPNSLWYKSDETVCKMLRENLRVSKINAICSPVIRVGKNRLYEKSV